MGRVTDIPLGKLREVEAAPLGVDRGGAGCVVYVLDQIPNPF